MKKVLLLFSLILLSSYFVVAQRVDSVRVEQAGDFIKIHFKILDSNPNQVFRVSALCSIDGGLKSQMNSLVGDFGDNVTGGRADYMIIWDVLKDISELKSAEFFIKAELVKDLSVRPQGLNETKRFFSDAEFSLMLSTSFPGPQSGLRLGYMGTFGISVQLLNGKVPVLDEYETNTLYPDPVKTPVIGIDLTKRIINGKDFRMHLVAGIRNNDLMVYFAGPPTPVLWRQGMTGIEAGMIFSVKKLTAIVMVSQPGLKQLEKNDEKVVIASPYQFINLGIGVSF